MKRSVGSLNVIACCVVAAAVGTTGILVPVFGKARSGTASAKAECESCTLDLSFGQRLSSVVQPKSFCNTQELFAASGYVSSYPIDAACPLNGPPDDPAVRDAAIPNSSTPIKKVRLYFNVFRYNDGTGATATPTQIANAMTAMSNFYAAWRFEFTYQWRYVDNSKYRDCAQNEEWAMKRAYAVSPETQLNVFVVNTGGGSHGTFPWTTPALTVQGGIVLHFTHLPTNTILSHETGHCLGLWHTFHGVTEVGQCTDCYEPAGRDQTVGDTTGDFCSDTNPGTNSGACADPGTIDPCSGNAWIDTPFLNIMSYSSCNNTFSAQQAGRMHAWTDYVLSGWLVVPAPPTAPGSPSLSKSGGTVTIVWADNSNDEDTFVVQRESKSGNSWGNTTTVATVGANVTSATDVPGAAGTYRYRVQAVNVIGGSWSGWTQIKL